jgi:ABC-type transport system substrate-binding protein
LRNRGVIIFLLFAFLISSISGCDESAAGDGAGEMVLYSALSAKVRSMDPGDIGDVISAKVTGQFFECLYQYHYLKRPYEIIPQLAESLPEISEDGLTYTIKIKKGVRFVDDECFAGGKGRELKSSDFVFAWKRIANIKYLSQNWWIFDSKIVALDEFREYTKTCGSMSDVDYSRQVEGLQAPDDYTLVIKLTKRWPQIVYLLAHQPTGPVAEEAVDLYGKDIISHPVGTGPYKLKQWNRGSYIEMVRNENFRDEFYPTQGEESDAENGFLVDAGKKLPMVDRLFFVIITEEQPRWLQFMRGKIDATGIPKDNFSQAISVSRGITPEMQQRGIHLKKFRDPSTFWISFNMEDPIVGKSKNLRKAISYSVNRSEYIKLFWNGRDEVAYGFIPPMMKAYNPDVKGYGISFDADKAREFVKAAQQDFDGKLPAIKFSMGGTGTLSRQIGQYYQNCFSAVGLDVEMDYMDWPTFQQKVKTKSVQMFSLGWIGYIPDTENFLQVFYSKNVSPGTNNFNYVNPEFDSIYEQISVMPDCSERTELYRKAEKIVIDDCLAVFINHRVAYVLHHDWVGNYKPHVFQYGLAKYRRIDTEKRKAYKELLRKLK